MRDAAFGQLAGEGAELVGQRDEGLELGRFFRRDRGEVDGVGDRAAQQIIRHLFGDLQRDVLLRFARGGAEMRRAHDIGMAEQRIFGRGLGHEDVEGGAGDVAGIERGAQRHFVDQTAARAIDDAHALFGLGER